MSELDGVLGESSAGSPNSMLVLAMLATVIGLSLWCGVGASISDQHTRLAATVFGVLLPLAMGLAYVSGRYDYRVLVPTFLVTACLAPCMVYPFALGAFLVGRFLRPSTLGQPNERNRESSAPPAISDPADAGQVSAVLNYFFRFDPQVVADGKGLGPAAVESVKREVSTAIAAARGRDGIVAIFQHVSAAESGILEALHQLVTVSGALDRLQASGQGFEDVLRNPERYMDSSNAGVFRALQREELRNGTIARIMGWIVASSCGVDPVNHPPSTLLLPTEDGIALGQPIPPEIVASCVPDGSGGYYCSPGPPTLSIAPSYRSLTLHHGLVAAISWAVNLQEVDGAARRQAMKNALIESLSRDFIAETRERGTVQWTVGRTLWAYMPSDSSGRYGFTQAWHRALVADMRISR